jgi:hypothetical protein
MRPSFNYAAVRLIRSGALATAVGSVTNEPILCLAVVASSELASVTVDAVRILPLFGNWFWFFALFPVVVETYISIYMFSFNEHYQREFEAMVSFSLGVLVTLLTIMERLYNC